MPFWSSNGVNLLECYANGVVVAAITSNIECRQVIYSWWADDADGIRHCGNALAEGDAIKAAEAFISKRVQK